jgi:hypothetical protein
MKLQPPGAGLPAFELAWLRIFLRVACAMISRNAGLQWFKFESEKILALARRVPGGAGAIPLLINRLGGRSFMGASGADRADSEGAEVLSLIYSGGGAFSQPAEGSGAVRSVPLQPRVMCACHRTSPAATLLRAERLYFRARRRTKGTALPEADKLHGLPLRQRRDRRRFDSTLARQTSGRKRSMARSRPFVRATGGHAAVNEDSTARTEADDADALCNAAALAARGQKERFRSGSAA